MENNKVTNSKRRMRPGLTPESEENQMISLAYNLAKQQLMDGTASSQVITHFLKLGTTVAQLEKERLQNENKLLAAKTRAIDSTEEVKVLYKNAIKAMQKYSGHGDSDDGDDDDY